MVAEAGVGQKFLLQGGDCAERFQDCREDVIAGKMKILLQMALVMGYAGRKAVIPIGRMAGQYAKPRSESHEVLRTGERIPIFRGESVNSYDGQSHLRTPDPLRLLQAYHCSSATLNFIRTLMASGFGELRQVDGWSEGRVMRGAYWNRYEQIVSGLRDALAFMSSVSGAEVDQGVSRGGFRNFYVSHEALVLPYEAALTRFVPEMGRYYNLSAHMVWIGDRTRTLDGAHVEYCRGIGNPIGIKVGSDADPREISALVDRVNPHGEPGKITIISRLGCAQVSRKLPELIQALADHHVTWVVDPMHGNTVRTSDGLKTRRFEDIVGELRETFAVHAREGSVLGGIHLEMTSEPVTECTGGLSGISDSMLGKKYETWCDPRLNGDQSLELAFVAAQCLRLDSSCLSGSSGSSQSKIPH